MRLVIAEKPSVAQSIAAVLGAKRRGAGYIEGDGYLVSWCVGHLAELAGAEAYDEKYAKWHYETLPIIPENWRFTVGKDKRKQFETLNTLMHRDDVIEVINGCDAGREGEMIFRTVYDMSGCSKPLKRLWISSMEDEAIRQGFANLKPGSDYDGLHHSALCRSKADWLVGINATRLFSVLYHRTLNIGRVMSPTLALLVQREAEIEAFKSEPFFTVILDCKEFSAESERIKECAGAEAVIAACKGKEAVVLSVECKEKAEKPPALYDLTSLQRDANRLLGYTAQQTLDYLQSLYEKKLCTYPRTDSHYLTDDMEGTVPVLISIAAALDSTVISTNFNIKQVCNSAKVSDHHAIVPTRSSGKPDVLSLPAGEREILLLVARRLLCSVSAAHRYAETAVVLDCGGNIYTARGKTVIEPGWKVYTQTKADTPLPEMVRDQPVPVAAITIKEERTAPPKHYTEDTLLSAMETAGANEMPEDAERTGLGTPATRAAILEKLVSTGFVERKKAKKIVNLIPTQIGMSLITVLPEQLQSSALTAEWEHQLKEIERGELNQEAFLCNITSMLHDLVKAYSPIKGAEVLFPSRSEVIGCCPRCGGDVIESRKGFFCVQSKCRFGLWKDNRFFTAKRKTLTKVIAAMLLKNGRATLAGCYSEKTGKTYDATVVLMDTPEGVNFRLDFDREVGR